MKPSRNRLGWGRVILIVLFFILIVVITCGGFIREKEDAIIFPVKNYWSNFSENIFVFDIPKTNKICSGIVDFMQISVSDFTHNRNIFTIVPSYGYKSIWKF